MLAEKYPSAGAPELVTFGETMVLLKPAGANGLEFSPQLVKSFGGAESNLAIGASRLGRRVGWFGQLGNDPHGRYIFKHIRGEGVDVSRASLVNGAPTGLMFKESLMEKTSVYYYRKHSAASLVRPEDLDEDYIRQAKILHVTGITAALSESGRAAVEEAMRLARKHGVKISYDPNLRLKLWSLEEARKTLLPLAEMCDYFLPGLDELKLLYATDEFDAIIERLKQLPAVSVIKGCENETLLLADGVLHRVPYFKVDRVVDTVGAGDGFCAGFLSGLLKGFALTESVKLGNLVGSIVVQTDGDWEGLPTWEQASAILNHEEHVER